MSGSDVPQLEDSDIVVKITRDVLSMCRHAAHSPDDTSLGILQVVRAHDGEESESFPYGTES